jgi:hypothetical protein
MRCPPTARLPSEHPLSYNRSLRRLVHLFIQKNHGRLSPAGRLAAGLPGIKGISWTMAMPDRAVREFVRLLLWQAQQDGAAKLTIGAPTDPDMGVPIQYRVGDDWFEVSPPPAWLHPLALAELERVAGLAPDAPYPKEGIVDLALFTGPVKWSLRVTGPDGQCELRSLAT